MGRLNELLDGRSKAAEREAEIEQRSAQVVSIFLRWRAIVVAGCASRPHFCAIVQFRNVRARRVQDYCQNSIFYALRLAARSDETGCAFNVGFRRKNMNFPNLLCLQAMREVNRLQAEVSRLQARLVGTVSRVDHVRAVKERDAVRVCRR